MSNFAQIFARESATRPPMANAKAMTYLSLRERRTKAIAEVLAIIAGAYPELAPDRPDSDREAEEWLWDIASGYCAALDRYAARTMQVKREHH